MQIGFMCMEKKLQHLHVAKWIFQKHMRYVCEVFTVQLYSPVLQGRLEFIKQSQKIYLRPSYIHDIFEPNLIRRALTGKSTTLGSLIFGAKEWEKLLGTNNFGIVLNQEELNPLTNMFRKRSKY